MTINEFIRKFRRAIAKRNGTARLTGEATETLRIESGNACYDCPITLVARVATGRGFQPLKDWGVAARRIGLSERAAESIVQAADEDNGTWLRRRLLGAAGVGAIA